MRTSHLMTQPCSKSFLSNSPNHFPDFRTKAVISTIFLEHSKHILLLKRSHKEDQPSTWGIPGGKAEKGEGPLDTLLREVKEETQITLEPSQISYQGNRYVRIPGWDYIVHIYHAHMLDRPVVQLDPREHSAFEWVSLYAFKLMPLLKAQDEIFDVVYANRLWQRIDSSTPLLERTQEVANLVFRKGDNTLVFNHKRRLILNLIGTSGSGKGTQGDMLSKIFGIPSVSAGDLFRDEFRANSKLGSMVMDYDKAHYPAYLPDEVPIGMMAKRLSGKDCREGFILDGFPRTKHQGDAAREVFLRPEDVHVPIFMNVPEEDIWDRLPQRSICSNCGHQVRKFDENPFPGFCPIEAREKKFVKLEKRPEDEDQSKTERRLKMFRDNKSDIISSMNLRDTVKTFELNNEIPPREVLHLLCSHIQECFDRLDPQNNSKLNRFAVDNIPSKNIMLFSCAILVSFLVGSAIFNRGNK